MTKMNLLVNWISEKKPNTAELLQLWIMSMLISVRVQHVKVPGSTNENMMNWNPLDLITQKVLEN